MKRKLLLAALCVVGALGFRANAQQDVTATYVKNADLSTDVTAENNGWTCTWRQDFQKAYDDSHVNVVEFYSGWGSLEHTTFSISQELTLPAGDYRIAVNAFFRHGDPGDGKNEDAAYIFAGEKKQNVYALTSGALNSYTAGGIGGSEDLQKASNAFYQGKFSNAFDFSLAEDGTIDIGFAGTFDVYRSWVILGPIKLYKYSLEDYLVDYRTKVAEAEALYNSPMNAGVLSALKDAVVDESNFSLSSEVTAAIATLTTAINNANNSIADYARVKAKIDDAKEKAKALDAAGQAAFDIASIETAYTTGSIENIDGAISNIANALAVAVKSQTTENADMTLALANPSFEDGFAGWTNNGLAAQGNTSFGKTGSIYAEKWQPNGTFGVSQTLTLLNAGLYQLSAKAKARGVTSAKLFAGGIDKAITVADQENEVTVNFACDANTEISLGFEGTGTGAASSWLCVDNFTLKYVGALPDVTAVEGKMNAEVASAQTAAVNAYTAEKTVANYNAAVTAIAAAQASVNAYTDLAAAVNTIKAAATSVKANGGTITSEQYTELTNLYVAYETGTIEDAEVKEKVKDAYGLVAQIVKTQTAAPADFTLAIINPSFEYGDMTGWKAEPSDDTGVRETSNATYATTGSDGDYLFNTWSKGVPLTQKVEGLPNGQYTLTASVASDGAIFLIANGEHNDGSFNNTPGVFMEGTLTFLVKDGTATIGAVGGESEGGAYTAEGGMWYKADNFLLVKNRDLTEEEAAVIPTGVALYNGETEVTEQPIALDATTTTVTLTPVFTPENATPSVVWTSSDQTVATVANGVVTAVAPGSATITVTSTFDQTVTASATVTVTYPETAVAAKDEVISGPALSTVTYGKNLIKNGTFEYPDGFYGWTDATTNAAKLASSNFEIATDGDSKYLKGKVSKGSTDAGSIGTSWPIEAGKTYVFGYRVKANQTIGDKSKYHKVTLTNTPGTETKQVSDDNTPVTNSWTEVKYKFTNEEYAYVQFRARWLSNDLSFDDFYLVEVTDETTIGNVAYATDAIPTANVGAGAFQYSQDAIDAANELVQGTASVADVEAAYEALTTVNAPADGQLFNVVLTYAGWTYDQKAMTYLANDRKDGGLYNIQYKEAANQNLAQAFTFTKVEGNNYKMSQIDADGNARYLSTGVPYSGNTSQIRTTTNADDALVVTVIPTATEGVYNLLNTAANNYLGSQDAGVYTVNSHIDFNIVETQKPSITINTTEAGWGTVMLPFAVAAIPSGVKVYSCAEVNGTTLTLTEVNAIKANKPYIIEGAWNVALTGDAQGTALTYTEGLLTGVYAETKAPDGSYVLQNQDGKVAFYVVDEDETGAGDIKVPANKAYLTVPSSANVRGFFFPESGDATGIAGIEALTSGNYDAIYTAGGAKVESLQKGLNIVVKDGKSYKIFVK